MIAKTALAVAVVAILATAAIVRPPRAAPALSFATAVAAVEAERAKPVPRRVSRDSRYRKHQRRSRHHDNVPLHRIDLNRADAGTIARIPGVGDWLAWRIVAYRGLVGPFETLDDLSDLDGISATRLASLGRYVVVR
ncbi:MAG: helix-hairpin-helix domain-containing protein [Vulcanimicrobiaceae bacterium]|jgi:DNA uptake protein ComE-like DNA-binding protein